MKLLNWDASGRAVVKRKGAGKHEPLLTDFELCRQSYVFKVENQMKSQILAIKSAYLKTTFL